jgi:hypothetical protein
MLCATESISSYADEELTAFLELESKISWFGSNRLDSLIQSLRNSASLNGSESGGGPSSRQVLRLFRTRHSRNLTNREKRGRTMKSLIQRKKATPLFVVTLLLACFGLTPLSRAVMPPPDGGYPGGNTAEGRSALLSLTTGGFNTAVGFLSLRSDTTGELNTAIGAGALANADAVQNTATGAAALLSNAAGSFNTANGTFALVNNISGESNTAIGDSALYSNTATGTNALYSNTEGNSNAAFGDIALYSNTTGVGNTAVGSGAIFNNMLGYEIQPSEVTR